MFFKKLKLSPWKISEHHDFIKKYFIKNVITFFQQKIMNFSETNSSSRDQKSIDSEPSRFDNAVSCPEGVTIPPKKISQLINISKISQINS